MKEVIDCLNNSLQEHKYNFGSQCIALIQNACRRFVLKHCFNTTDICYLISKLIIGNFRIL